jgi:hypothetical protein
VGGEREGKWGEQGRGQEAGEEEAVAEWPRRGGEEQAEDGGGEPGREGGSGKGGRAARVRGRGDREREHAGEGERVGS